MPIYKSNYKEIKANTPKSLNSFLFNSNFGAILVNNDYVFRLYFSSTPDSKTEDAINNVKENVLQIFDRNLSFIKNIPLNFQNGFSGMFIDDNQLYFPVLLDNENELGFHRLTIETKS